VEELDKFGVKHTLKKWIPGNAHAAMKWLAARRSKIYREQKDVHHTMNMDDAFLRFLDQMDAQQKALSDIRSPELVVETVEIQGVHVPKGNSEVTGMHDAPMLSDMTQRQVTLDEAPADADKSGGG
jgi:hypothetical protein